MARETTLRMSSRSLPRAGRGFVAFALLAFSLPAMAVLPPLPKAGKFGMIDASGSQVLPSVYDSIGTRFTSGLAPIRKDGLTGFVDMKGRIAIPLRYPDASEFDEAGVCIAKDAATGKYGLLDTDGHWAVQPQYDRIRRFDDYGLALATRDGKERLIDRSGRPRLKTDIRPAFFAANGLGLAQVEGKWGFIDLEGGWAIPAQYSYARSFGSNGLALVVDGKGTAFIDSSGNVVQRLPAGINQHEDVEAGGRALIQNSVDARWGFADDRGRIVIPPIYETAGPFREGFAIVQLNGKRGMLDRQGRFAVPARFEGLGSFDEAGMAPAKQDGLWGYIDRDLKFVVPPQFEDVGRFASNGLAKAVKDGRLGFIDRRGETAIPFVYYQTTGYETSGFNDAGYAVVETAKSPSR